MIRTYNDDFSLVHRKYQQYSSGDAYVRLLMERPIIAQTAQKQVYEVDSERPVGRSVSTAGEDQVIEPGILRSITNDLFSMPALHPASKIN